MADQAVSRLSPRSVSDVERIECLPLPRAVSPPVQRWIWNATIVALSRLFSSRPFNPENPSSGQRSAVEKTAPSCLLWQRSSQMHDSGRVTWVLSQVARRLPGETGRFEMEMHDGSAKVVFDMKEKGTRRLSWSKAPPRQCAFLSWLLSSRLVMLLGFCSRDAHCKDQGTRGVVPRALKPTEKSFSRLTC